MTADEVIDAALARCTDLGQTTPTARSVYYRRIGIRQGQIFSKVASTNPHYFGVTAVVAWTGSYDLANLVPKAERVSDVRVNAVGTSGHRAGDKVNLIALEDFEAFLSPRAVIRNQVLSQIAQDLQGVASLTIHYSKRPAASSAVTKLTPMELPEQFQDLLVIDLARQMIRKLLDVEPGRRDGWVQLLNEEEAELFATLDEHARFFSMEQQQRFRPPSAPIRGGDNA